MKKIISSTLFNLILLNQLVDSADIAIFYCLYKSIADEFGIGPQKLGMISLSQTLSRAISCPLWGFLADKLDKGKLLSLGCFIWGLATLLTGFTTSVTGLYICRTICGIGLGCVTPVIQSLIAGSSKKLGYSFGLLSIANMIGSFTGTYFGNHVEWRKCFYILGSLSLLLAFCDYRFIKAKKKSTTSSNLTFGQLFKEIVTVFSSPSLRIIMAQGVIGTIPWVAFNYNTFFFQSAGFSPTQITILLTAFSLACGLGGFLGGLIGDYMHSRIPYNGRLITAQMSVLLGIPFTHLILTLEPNVSNFNSYLILLILLGLCCSWCSSGCNRPLFCDIVPTELQSTAISWVIAVDDSLSGVAAPIVGYLAENVYGFKKTNKDISLLSPELAYSNAVALKKSLFVSMIYPWTLCLFTYSFLYWTYGNLIMFVSNCRVVKEVKKRKKTRLIN